jgi:hypothetical protein
VTSQLRLVLLSNGIMMHRYVSPAAHVLSYGILLADRGGVRERLSL